MPQDFPLGNKVIDSTVMHLPYKSRDEGTIIIGQNRFGKSSLMLRMMEHDLFYNTSFIALDPHGDLIYHYLAGLEIPPITHINHIMGRISRADIAETYLLQIDQDNPFGLNLYECDDW